MFVDAGPRKREISGPQKGKPGRNNRERLEMEGSPAGPWKSTPTRGGDSRQVKAPLDASEGDAGRQPVEFAEVATRGRDSSVHANRLSHPCSCHPMCGPPVDRGPAIIATAGRNHNTSFTHLCYTSS